jgi:hypothetical protein
MRSSRLRTIDLLATACAPAAPAAAGTPGNTDDSQDATTQYWGSGSANPKRPVNVPDVGPTGPGDDSLQISILSPHAHRGRAGGSRGRTS